MFRTIKTIQDVVDWDQCIGCGACYYACANNGVRLFNIEKVGVRPKFDSDCSSCNECLEICPGYFVDGDRMMEGRPKTCEEDHEFGQTLEIWEGYASDPAIRHSGSSGGLLTALSLYCLEKEGMESVVHTGMDEDRPWLNRTYQSVTREDVLSRTGSRYNASSPCEGLDWIEKGERPSVFVGKPCDAAAVGHLVQKRPELDTKVGAILTFFCAGTPSAEGTLDLLSSLHLSKEEIDALRYRGEGWPGRFRALYEDRTKEKNYTYQESWGRLTKYRPWRCHICPHGLGRVADISCGDAWRVYEEEDKDPGQSVVLVRTERGRRILQGAIESGYVTLKPASKRDVIDSQGLVGRRRVVFGRLLAMKLLLRPTPEFLNFSLFRAWNALPLKERVKSILGTLRRLVKRGMWRKRPIDWDKVVAVENTPSPAKSKSIEKEAV